MSDFYPIPAPEGVRDTHTRRVLEALRANIEKLVGRARTPEQRAVLVEDLARIGLVAVENGRVSWPRQRASSAASIGGSAALVCEFDAGSGLGAGVYTLDATLPEGSVVMRAFYEVRAAFAGSGATLAIGIEEDSPTGILSATGIGTAGTVGWKQCAPTGAANTFLPRTTAPRTLRVVVGGGALTAGRLVLYVEHMMAKG